jgi:hypothetical protein
MLISAFLKYISPLDYRHTLISKVSFLFATVYKQNRNQVTSHIFVYKIIVLCVYVIAMYVQHDDTMSFSL